MSVCFGVIVRTRINHRCVCVSSGVLVRSAPCDPGVCVLSPLCRSASSAGFSDGAVPRRLCGQKPLQAGPASWLWQRTRLFKTHCIGSSGSRPQLQSPIGFSRQMQSSICHIKICQPPLGLRRKYLSFPLTRNVDQVNPLSWAMRGGGAFLAGTSISEKSAPTGLPVPSASRRTDRHRAPTRYFRKPPCTSHCGRPKPSHPS